MQYLPKRAGQWQCPPKLALVWQSRAIFLDRLDFQKLKSKTERIFPIFQIQLWCVAQQDYNDISFRNAMITISFWWSLQVYFSLNNIPIKGNALITIAFKDYIMIFKFVKNLDDIVIILLCNTPLDIWVLLNIMSDSFLLHLVVSTEHDSRFSLMTALYGTCTAQLMP